MSEFKKPKSFDCNLLVIGAGAAGLVSSYIAAAVNAKVILIEGHRMGGDCLNTGCVPSKSLLRTAQILHYMDNARAFGLKNVRPEFSFSEIMEKVQQSVNAIAPHDSIQRYTELGVECIKGYARFVSPWQVEVNGRIVSARSIIIATGARPAILPIPGLANTEFLTSDTVWDLRQKPERLAILGGGPIGCELSQAFARLGIEVTQIEMQSRLLANEDEAVSEHVSRSLMQDGVKVLTNHKVQSVDRYARDKVVVCEHNGQRVAVHCDEILVAVGRTPNTDGLGLDILDIQLNANKTITTDAYLRVPKYKHILACGDVAGPFQFTHTAAHQAWYAAVNGLFAPFKKFKANYRVIPWATFTDPEVARVGLNEQQAKVANITVEVTQYSLSDLDRAITDSAVAGFVKVLTKPGKDKILGVTIVGRHAGEMIAEFVLAMKQGIGLNTLLGTIHIYPTLNEANKNTAGLWKLNHKPERLLRWVEKFHQWRLGKKKVEAIPPKSNLKPAGRGKP